MAAVGTEEWQQSVDPQEWARRVRDAVRSDYDSESHQVTRFWRLNRWEQPDSLDEAFLSHLDIRSAVHRLKVERLELWQTIMIVDILRPFAPANVAAVPPECRRKDGIEKACRALGLSKSGVEDRLERGWGMVTTWLLEVE